MGFVQSENEEELKGVFIVTVFIVIVTVSHPHPQDSAGKRGGSEGLCGDVTAAGELDPEAHVASSGSRVASHRE